MLDLRRLRLLSELSRRGTIAEVARVVGYTPSAISQALAQLEREVGTALLERDGRRVRLTPAAHALVARTERALAELDAAEAELAAEHDAVRGEIVIGAFPSAAAGLVVPAVAELGRQHPELVCSVREHEPEDGIPLLRSGALDMLVSERYEEVEPAAAGGLESTLLMSERLLLVLPRSDRRRSPVALETLAGERWIAGPAGTQFAAALEQACRSAGFRPLVAHRADDALLFEALVAAGAGIGLLPALACTGTAGVRLAELAAPAPPRRQIDSSHPPRRRTPARARRDPGGAPGCGGRAGVTREPGLCAIAQESGRCARRHRGMAQTPASRRILFLVSAHNSLSQRAFIALTELGHRVEVEVVDSGEAMEAAVELHRPELIVCPMLKRFIPESIWSTRRCLVVHPGPMGDRGPSSLDWAIELGVPEWGVTVLEANGDFDAGDVWATRTFPMRAAGKGSIYRHEVRRSAIDALVEAVGKLLDGGAPVDDSDARVIGRARPLMQQDVRAIDWSSDPTETVLRKIRAAEGHPGVLDEISGVDFHLFGAHRERGLSGAAGELVAQRHGAICRATVDGAVWITHLRRSGPADTHFKLPATLALELAGRPTDAREVGVPVHGAPGPEDTYREISYEEDGGVGYLRFDFYNGAMSSGQCRRLREAYLYARSRRQTKVIVLMGGDDFFSNGIHLNVIEAADDPAAESWRNLNAINDVVRDIVETDSHLVISALAGDAAAGGVPFALAADRVYAREDVVLNPYYRHMGGLYGSEYWTYLLPRRVGNAMAARLTGPPFTPLGAAEAVEIGLLDAAFGATAASFRDQVRSLARMLASYPRLGNRLEAKRRRRTRDESLKPLRAYRAEEMARSHECFFGPDRSYHEARARFTRKLGADQTSPAQPSSRLAA